MSVINECWRDIDQYPNYQISDDGYVRNKKTNEYLKLLLNNDDYLYVDLYNDLKKGGTHKRIHRLVIESFVGKKDNYVVNHIDGNKLNNNLHNLEYVTPQENSTKAAEQCLYKTRPIII